MRVALGQIPVSSTPSVNLERVQAALREAADGGNASEAEEALRGARTRMARKPPALARELLRNFPKRRARGTRRRRKGAKGTENGLPVGGRAVAVDSPDALGARPAGASEADAPREDLERPEALERDDELAALD